MEKWRQTLGSMALLHIRFELCATEFFGKLIGRRPRHLRQNLKWRTIFARDVLVPLLGCTVARSRRPTAPGSAQIRALLDLGQTQEIEGRFLVFRFLRRLSRQCQRCCPEQGVTISHSREL